MTYKSS